MKNHKHSGIYLIAYSDKGNLLLVRKKRGPYSGTLDLPGGSAEPGESPLQTLIREVLEETGVVLSGEGASHLFETSLVHIYRESGSEEYCRLNHRAKIFKTIDLWEEVPLGAGDSFDSAGAVWADPRNSHLSPLVKHALRELEEGRSLQQGDFQTEEKK